MAELLSATLFDQRKPRKAEERDATRRLDQVFRAVGIPEESRSDCLRRLPAALFDDVSGSVHTDKAHDIIARFFLHNERAEPAVMDAARVVLARASLQRDW